MLKSGVLVSLTISFDLLRLITIIREVFIVIIWLGLGNRDYGSRVLVIVVIEVRAQLLAIVHDDVISVIVFIVRVVWISGLA